MSDPKPQQEPSMEEILASIRRIIAEDEKPAEPAPAAEKAPQYEPENHAENQGESEVLELTELIEDDGSISPASPSPAASAPPALPDPPSFPDGRIEPEPPAIAVDAPVTVGGEPGLQRAGTLPLGMDTGRILSSATSGAAAAAFARLAAVPRERRQSDIPVSAGGGRTLEDIVRDTLRPLLQNWLDDHLPELVERLVRAEIVRVLDEAGLR